VTQLVVESSGVSTALDPRRTYRVGRDPEADIVVAVEGVSRSHAVLRFEGGEWVIEDAGSANGTYDEGRRIQRTAVTPGTQVRLGHPDEGVPLVFRAGEDPMMRPGAEPTARAAYPQPPQPPQQPDADQRTSPHQAPPAMQPEPPHERAGAPGQVYPPAAPQPAAAVQDDQSTAAPTSRQQYSQQPPTQGQPFPQQPRTPDQPFPQQPLGQGQAYAQQPPTQGQPFPQQPLGQGQAYPQQMPTQGQPYPGGPQRPSGGMPRPPMMQTMSGQYREPAKIRNIEGSKVLRIGRMPDNDLVIGDDLRVSRYHAELRSAGGTYEIIDVGSRTGTYVNGRRVERAVVGPQDIIGIGPVTYHLVGDVLMQYVDTGAVSLSAHDLTVTVDKGKILLDHVTFPLGEKCLVAVIGPSGSGKSTLLRALTGLRPADHGTVSYDGRDLYRDYAELRSRIGLVPQDDILHTQLTVRRALIYAAELRFPDDTRQHERKARVDEVLKELGLDHRKDNKVSALSGGQRKRVSVALELLTKPSLLFLDEPTSGLDPGLDKSVMQMLRGLADDGRTVAVVTHSVANLDICDRLLVMAPGGRIAYFGPPKEALPFLGFSDWADVFQAFDDPSRDWGARYLQSPAHQKYVQTELVQPMAQTGPVEFQQPPKAQSWPEQLSTLIRRYIRGIVADPMFLGITIALPIIMGLLARVVPTGDLLAHPGGNGSAANLLLILCIGGCLTGAANAVRELVKERPIYQRERAVGLSRSAYLASKLLVLGVITIGQGIVLTLVAMLGVTTHDKGVITTPLTELVLAIALLSFTAMTLGLLISALVKTSEMTMPLLVLSTLVQVVFCGALVHLDGKPVLEQISWLVPARWALAAMAGTLNVGQLIPHFTDPPDPLWKQDLGTWVLNMGAMLVLAVALTFGVVRMLRRQEPEVMRKK
jgi:ABC-type multidrug transport system ATPase subunit/pSer/pThr/pTyr-binding forkhead associated (FHA) protein